MERADLPSKADRLGPGAVALPDEALNRIVSIVGREHVLLDEAERRFFSSDVYRSGDLAGAVVAPGSKDEVVEIVAAATRAGVAVMPRGGGLSYADGYLPDRPNSIVIDMRRLDRIVEINEDDMYVTVEAGCTWAVLFDALKARRLRTPFFGPFSGRYATVGGAVTQNSMFHGCTLHGAAVDSVLGIEVVTADGTLLKAGSAATPYAASPFFRAYGPDLVGLFLADGGALGVKVEITLRVIRAPVAVMCASFGYDDVASICRSMSAIARESLASECFSFDSQTHHLRVRRMQLNDGVRAAVGVAAAEQSLVSGLRKGLNLALSGRRFLDGVSQSLHVVVEGRSEAEADARMAELRSLALKEGREIANSIPVVMSATPFPEPTGLLGPEGQRWVPVLGLVPHSRAVAMIEAFRDYLDGHAGEMKAHGAEWSYLTQICGTAGFFIEVELYWQDRRPAFHERYLGPDYIKRLKDFPDNPNGRALVERLRRGLVELFLRNGAVHSHIGKMYPYREGKAPETFALLQAIKAHLDPQGLINPGALGLPQFVHWKLEPTQATGENDATNLS